MNSEPLYHLDKSGYYQASTMQAFWENGGFWKVVAGAVALLLLETGLLTLCLGNLHNLLPLALATGSSFAGTVMAGGLITRIAVSTVKTREERKRTFGETCKYIQKNYRVVATNIPYKGEPDIRELMEKAQIVFLGETHNNQAIRQANKKVIEGLWDKESVFLYECALSSFAKTLEHYRLSSSVINHGKRWSKPIQGFDHVQEEIWKILVQGKMIFDWLDNGEEKTLDEEEAIQRHMYAWITEAMPLVTRFRTVVNELEAERQQDLVDNALEACEKFEKVFLIAGTKHLVRKKVPDHLISSTFKEKGIPFVILKVKYKSIRTDDLKPAESVIGFSLSDEKVPTDLLRDKLRNFKLDEADTTIDLFAAMVHLSMFFLEQIREEDVQR